MQKLFRLSGILCIAYMSFCITGCKPAQMTDDPSTIRQLDSLLDKKEYFRLERQVSLQELELSAPRRLYFVLHLHMLDVNYREGAGVTGISFTVSLGVADSLYIGNTLVRNVVFQVMPDSILYLAAVRFQLNMIIGFPVIAGLQEIRIYDDGRMLIPQARSTA